MVLRSSHWVPNVTHVGSLEKSFIANRYIFTLKSETVHFDIPKTLSFVPILLKDFPGKGNSLNVNYMQLMVNHILKHSLPTYSFTGKK